MEQFILLLLVFTGGSHGFLPTPDTKCDAIRPKSPCSPVVGGSVNIKLLTNATGYKLNCYKVHTKTNRSEIFSLRRDKVQVADAYKNRTEFSVDTGTLKIDSVAWNDAGRYVVEGYDNNGKYLTDIEFNLQVKVNIYPILLPCIVAFGAFLLMVLLICCICCRLKRRRNTKGKDNGQTL